MLNTASPVRWSPRGDADLHKPVAVRGTSIATWTEQNYRYFLLSGGILVEQGLARFRFDQGVIRTDEQQHKQTGIYQLEIHAEGGVTVEDGALSQGGTTGQFLLRTRDAVTFTVPKTPGTYTYLCSFAGHYAAGMWGQLIVK